VTLTLERLAIDRRDALARLAYTQPYMNSSDALLPNSSTDLGAGSGLGTYGRRIRG
jgi:hypothetical protein